MKTDTPALTPLKAVKAVKVLDQLRERVRYLRYSATAYVQSVPMSTGCATTSAFMA